MYMLFNIHKGNFLCTLVTEKATAMYRDVLKADVSAAEHLPEHGVTTVFVNLPNTKLEVRLLFC